MPFFILILIAVLLGIALIVALCHNMFDDTGHGFKGFYCTAIFLLPLFVGSILWVSMACDTPLGKPRGFIQL